MTSKSTKRALLTSTMSILLCFTMLLGTTFAWFTDSVTSANNVIKSGNLDVEFEYWNEADNAWKTVKDASDILTNELWEPGVTEVAYLKVSNAGSLALKYQLGVNIVSETAGKNVAEQEFKLSDYIYFGVVEGVTENTYSKDDAGRASAIAAVTDSKKISAGYTKESSILATGDAHNFALVVYMPETVTNDANHNGTDIPQIDLGINVVATQLNSEKDSFGSDYDKDAEYPMVATKVSTEADLEEVISEGGWAVLDNDVALTKTLMANNDAIIDLNGNTLTTSSNTMFQSQSNAAPSMIITSSAPGAKINIAGGDTAVLLGYGSTEISNVTINVEDGDNKSPNPFNVYGDLTLGKGTVVNIDFLGTALISNNGKVAIDIDGAEINIGEFKANGSVITLNKASTLDMKNTAIKIGKFNLSTFGGEGLVNKVDGVTIENCTFDVIDSNGKSCTFVADAGLGRYDLVQE